jgi:hypothetical protein
MHFRIRQDIQAPPATVFRFLRDKGRSATLDRHPAHVLSLDKLSEGEPQVGTRYRETVRMLPFVTGTITSELIQLEPNRMIEESWRGAGMEGRLRYSLSPQQKNGARLQQEQSLYCRGWLKLLSPIIYLAFGIAIRRRLKGIKRLLESMPD